MRQPSAEDYVNDQQAVMFLTGQDEVTWTQSGNVFHLCQEASDVNRKSKNGQIFMGTTQQAVAAGKSCLTKKLAQEVRECSIDPQKLDGWENQDATGGYDEEWLVLKNLER